MREETIAGRGECLQSAGCEGICKEYLTIQSNWSGRNRCRRAQHLSACVRLVRDYEPALPVFAYDSTSRFVIPHRMCKRKVPTGKSAHSFPMKVPPASAEFEMTEVSSGE